MARLYRHKRHGWQIHYRVYYPDGTDKRKYRFFHNKLRAQDALQDLEALEHRSLKNTLARDDLLYCTRCGYLSQTEADKLLGAAILIPTLGELAGQFLRRAKDECRPSAYASYRIRTAHLLRFFGEGILVDSITPERIEAYRSERLQAVMPGTVNKEVMRLAQILDLAVRIKAIVENPARQVGRLRDKRGRIPRALSREEIDALLATARKEKGVFFGHGYEIIMTYLYTGMRREELVWLEWEEIDFAKRRVTIQAKPERGGFIPKPRTARVVGLAAKLAENLATLPHTGRYVFGGRLSLEAISNAFKKIVRRAGLSEAITLHSLRHTYITHLLEKGVNPRRVQELAGHKDFSTTWRYSHVLPSSGVDEDLLDF